MESRDVSPPPEGFATLTTIQTSGRTSAGRRAHPRTQLRDRVWDANQAGCGHREQNFFEELVSASSPQLKPQIPWLRVFVEGVVIVGSILLAFGIPGLREPATRGVEAASASMVSYEEATRLYEARMNVDAFDSNEASSRRHRFPRPSHARCPASPEASRGYRMPAPRRTWLRSVIGTG